MHKKDGAIRHRLFSCLPLTRKGGPLAVEGEKIKNLSLSLFAAQKSSSLIRGSLWFSYYLFCTAFRHALFHNCLYKSGHL